MYRLPIQIFRVMILDGSLVKVKYGKNRSKCFMCIVKDVGSDKESFKFTLIAAPKQTRADKMIKRLRNH